MDNDWKWFHPLLTRIECEHILKNKKCGTFLVRRSESSNTDLVLSLSSGINLYHYRIKPSSNGLFLDAADGVPQLYFSSCNELIQYYKKSDCGLPYILTNHVPCEGAIEQEKHTEDSDLSEDESALDAISPFFQQQFSVITGGRSDEVLQGLMKDYVEKGVNFDWQKVHSGATEPPQLQQLLARAAFELQVSLEKYLKRLEVIKELFAFGSGDYMENIKEDVERENANRQESVEKGLVDGPKDLDAILKMLNTCQTNIFKLEQKACKVFRETGGSGNTTSKGVQTVEVEYSPLPLVPSTPATYVSRGEHRFQVTSGHLKNKLSLVLNVREGKFYILKPNEDVESAVWHNCNKILQLVKSKSYKVKLSIVLDGQASKHYIFESYKSREMFCQRMQQMKIAHSTDITSSELSVFIGSWNMGDTPPPSDLAEWYKCMGLGKTKVESFSLVASDIVAIGTQESAFHEKEWVARIKSDLTKLFTQEFKLVTSCSLWGIRLVIFVKSTLMKLVNTIKQSTVRTGIANTLGNKGAVGISFNIGATSFCFVNCHLTSGIEKLARRNQNFHTILRGLDLGQSDTFDIIHSFHHFFWFGDLNYRIELEITEIIKCIMESDWATLIASDQLNNEIKSGKAFIQLEEEDLSFRPTYRYTRGTRSTYVWTKQKMTGNRTNVPSWCDRVLWKSYPCLTSINTAYGCTQSIDTSDHSPVFASFDVGLLSETLSTMSNDHGNGDMKDMKIVIHEVEAQVLTSSCTQFILEFHSNCLEKSYSSRVNSLENYEKKLDSLYQCHPDERRTHMYPWWINKDLMELTPIILDPFYLKDQHFLIAIKGNDGQESYGECVISLQPLLSGIKQTIERPLSHLGVDTGLLKMSIQMSMPEESQYMSSNQSKIYELISVADEDTNIEQKCVPLPVDKNKIQQVEPHDKVHDKLLDVKLLDCANVASKNEVFYENMINRPISPTNGKDKQRCHSQGCDTTSGSIPPTKPRRKKKEKIAKEFYAWLKTIGYDNYYDLLLTNGYDDLEYFCSITASDLEEIGISNEEHRGDIVRQAGNINSVRRMSTSITLV